MDRDRRERAYRLEGWHGLLVDRLVDTDAAGLLERLVAYPVLAVPEGRSCEPSSASGVATSSRAGG